MTAAILIADDDADTRAMLRAFVATEGYRVQSAASGDEVLRLIEHDVPDLILLDAVMPGLDGFETCRLIKQEPRTAPIPVIFMTGLLESEHVIRGLDVGGVDYVTKPLVLDQLAARIRVHLGNARSARSALVALDTTGARLLSCNVAGEVSWASPEAQRLLHNLTSPALEALRQSARALAASAGGTLPVDCDGDRFTLTLLAPSAPGESLLKLTRSIEGAEPKVLQQAFGLTPREADVLLWTARGKSNRDMSEILGISARTVNKHLEQIFVKIGVENRASAAAAATQVLAHVE